MIMFVPAIKPTTSYNPGQIKEKKELSPMSKSILQILDKGGLSFIEIVSTLGESKPQVMGTLTSLKKLGLVKKNEDGKFSLVH